MEEIQNQENLEILQKEHKEQEEHKIQSLLRIYETLISEKVQEEVVEKVAKVRVHQGQGSLNQK